MLQITRQMMEDAMPVAQTASDDLFERLTPYIVTAQEFVSDNITGTLGDDYVEADDANYIRTIYATTVCLLAMSYGLPQLDLVLTPTGFGVVSNDTLTPASKARVDALLENIRLNLYRSQARLVERLRHVEGWGAQEVATLAIPCVVSQYDYMTKWHGDHFKNWERDRQGIQEADTYLRKKVSSAMVDEVLVAYRTMNSGLTVLRGLMQRYTMARCSGNMQLMHAEWLNLMREVESDPVKYKAYHNSDEYKANHVENFQNAKDSSAYLFG